MASFLREDSPGAGIAKEVWQQEGGEKAAWEPSRAPCAANWSTCTASNPHRPVGEVSPLSLYR